MSNVKGLLNFLDHSHSAFHAVKNLSDILEANGFKYLKENEVWNLEKGNKYYTSRNNSSIIAFSIGNDLSDYHYQVCASHTDSPTFKIKDKAEIKGKGGYVSLNIEGYGGMILSTWLDRPLSVAGRVVYQKDGNIVSKLVDIDEDLLIIPNVAIHMNREINDGFKYNTQIDMLPLLSLDGKNCYYDILAKYLNINTEDILGCDMYLYSRVKSTILGANKELIASGRLDNLESAYCSLMGFVNGHNDKGINVYCSFDNEEVGSQTMQGAFSTFLYDCLYRINNELGYNDGDYHRAIASSFMLSIDNAHAVHPNHPEKTDVENCTYMNQGVVIKYNANQSYTSSGFSSAMLKQLCKNNNNIPYQVFANRSDARGGGTLGNISNNQVSLHAVDIGLAQLAMHSSYEVAGYYDVDHMINLCKAYFSTSIIVDDSKEILMK